MPHLNAACFVMILLPFLSGDIPKKTFSTRCIFVLFFLVLNVNKCKLEVYLFISN